MRAMCVSRGGKPKAAYATEEEARVAAERQGLGYHAYRCKKHGFHIGSSLSRALRAALGRY